MLARLRGLNAGQPTDAWRVLDVGAGTGALTLELYKLFSPERLVALDPALGMLYRCAKRLRGMSESFVVAGDAMALPFGNAAFDAVVSNFALQWCISLQQSLGEMIRVLAPGGWLAVAMPGAGSLSELTTAWQAVDARRHVHSFPELKFIESSLLDRGCKVLAASREEKSLIFPSALEVMSAVKGLGAANRRSDRSRHLYTPRQLSRVAAAYPRFQGSPNVVATYSVIMVIARTSG